MEIEDIKMILDILTISLSAIAIIFSTAQYFSEKNRSRKEATIHALDILEKEVFSKSTYKTLVVRDGTKFALNQKCEDDVSAWNEATLALSQIEHFAVGVNSGVYDLETLNRMAGSFIIKEYQRWCPIINTKRKQDPEHKHYDEFETMYKKIQKLKSKNK